MEKQRDKAARRMQRKAERQAGETSHEPDEFDVPAGESPDEPETDEPQASGV